MGEVVSKVLTPTQITKAMSWVGRLMRSSTTYWQSATVSGRRKVGTA